MDEIEDKIENKAVLYFAYLKRKSEIRDVINMFNNYYEKTGNDSDIIPTVVVNSHLINFLSCFKNYTSKKIEEALREIEVYVVKKNGTIGYERVTYKTKKRRKSLHK